MRTITACCIAAFTFGCKSDPSSAPVASAPKSLTAPTPATPLARPALAKADLSQPAVLVMGSAIGPFKLGMARADVEALAPTTTTSSMRVLTTGPYELIFDGSDQLASISRRLATNEDGTPVTGSLVIDGKTVDPATSFAALATLVPGCKAPVAAIGGTTAECDNHTSVAAGGPVGIVAIRVSTH
jgi:hypothetical protein